MAARKIGRRLAGVNKRYLREKAELHALIVEAYHDGMSQREISRALGHISQSTVSRLISEADGNAPAPSPDTPHNNTSKEIT